MPVILPGVFGRDTDSGDAIHERGDRRRRRGVGLDDRRADKGRRRRRGVIVARRGRRGRGVAAESRGSQRGEAGGGEGRGAKVGGRDGGVIFAWRGGRRGRVAGQGG